MAGRTGGSSDASEPTARACLPKEQQPQQTQSTERQTGIGARKRWVCSRFAPRVSASHDTFYHTHLPTHLVARVEEGRPHLRRGFLEGIHERRGILIEPSLRARALSHRRASSTDTRGRCSLQGARCGPTILPLTVSKSGALVS